MSWKSVPRCKTFGFRASSGHMRSNSDYRSQTAWMRSQVCDAGTVMIQQGESTRNGERWNCRREALMSLQTAIANGSRYTNPIMPGCHQRRRLFMDYYRVTQLEQRSNRHRCSAIEDARSAVPARINRARRTEPPAPRAFLIQPDRATRRRFDASFDVISSPS